MISTPPPVESGLDQERADHTETPRRDRDQRGVLKPKYGERHTCLLVAGMHRSGTSATGGVLAELGVFAGDELVPANRWNRKGHFELQAAVDINDRCLSELGLTWSSVQPLPPGWSESAAAKRAIENIAALFDFELKDAPLTFVKDPRMCRLLPLWLKGLASRGIEARVLMVLRNPREVAASLDVRDSLPQAQSYALWLLHMLELEHSSRQTMRTAVDFSSILGGWQPEMRRIARALKLDWEEPEGDTVKRVDRFLSRSLRHHEQGAEVVSDLPRYPTVEALARNLGRIGLGASPPQEAFDELRERAIEGMALWHQGRKLEAESRCKSITQELIDVLALPLTNSREQVFAAYWRSAGEDYDQTRSGSHRYDVDPGSTSRIRLSLPSAGQARFLRIDPAMGSGLFRVDRLHVNDVAVPLTAITRVNGTGLAARPGELLRLYAEHEDPWFELDLDMLGEEVCASPSLEVVVEFRRMGMLECIEMQLARIETVLSSPDLRRRPY